jgi:FlaG/FlaF family flagellin (archaellin)
MLKLLNTKLLIAILAVLAALASAAIYQRYETAKATAILKQRKQEDETNSAAGNEGKTWKCYIP